MIPSILCSNKYNDCFEARSPSPLPRKKGEYTSYRCERSYWADIGRRLNSYAVEHSRHIHREIVKSSKNLGSMQRNRDVTIEQRCSHRIDGSRYTKVRVVF